jgi:micrococcal nuclease
MASRDHKTRRWRRLPLPALVLALFAGALAVGDRMGLFGLEADRFQVLPRPTAAEDRAKYHDRTFLCTRVVDGDTLDVEPRDFNRPDTRIRLWGVDTPETVKPETPPQHFGPEASAWVHRQCEGRRLRLELDPKRDPRGKHLRLLAYVYLPDGRMLNRELIRQGYGYADPRFEHRFDDEFAALQAEARAARRGLWKDVRRRDLPYYYRDSLDLSR